MEILAHEHSLADRLLGGLVCISGVTVYKVKDRSEQAPVVSFNLEDSTPGEAGAILDQAFDIKVRTGFHCAPAAYRTLGTFPLGTTPVEQSAKMFIAVRVVVVVRLQEIMLPLSEDIAGYETNN